MMNAIFAAEDPSVVDRVYGAETKELLAKELGETPACYTKAKLLREPARFRDVRYLFSTWSMPVMTEDEIRTVFPALQAVFYAAGTVQSFARPFLSCGITVCSAWAANAIPVAEYTAAQIILANKGFFRLSGADTREDFLQIWTTQKELFPGNYHETVGILGAGMVGKQVIRLLKPYDLRILVFDPFLPEPDAQALGVKLCTLPEVFAQSQVVSNHLADNPQTRGMLGADLFSAMRPHAVFLNTGRGAQVVEDELVSVLEKRTDLTAVLDVTFPEPPCAEHAFYRLPNCILTPHIAGSSGNEVHRMAAYMAEEFLRFRSGEPCRFAVSEAMLCTMA